MGERKIIALELEKLRTNNNMCFSLPKGKIVLDEFYKLAIYCFVNFPIPESHQIYIDRNLDVEFTKENSSKSFFSFLKRPPKSPSFYSKENAKDIVTLDVMISQLIENWSNQNKDFCLELPLRTVEVLFNYGHFVVPDQKIEFLRKQINTLGEHIRIYHEPSIAA